MSSTSIDSGEEPPSKKPAIEPTTTLPLPDELVLCCLARVPRSHYPILSFVSKTFRSLTSSPELYQTRSLLNRTESCLYVCLQFPNDPNIRWFTLCRKPDKTLKKKKKKKTKETSTTGNVLGQVQFLGSAPPPVEWSKLVAVDHKLYAISAGPCSSNVFFLDCRTHTWVETPSLRLAHTDPERYGLVYLAGGSEKADSMNCVEVFNAETQTWNPGPPEKKIFSVTDLQGRAYRNNGVAASSSKGLVVARPKDSTLRLEGSAIFCLIEEILYRYDTSSSSGKLVWSNLDTESDVWTWRKVEGLEGLPKFARYSNVYLVESGGKLVVLWDKHVPARGGYKDKMIWCAEISLERRSSEEVWGKVEWFDAVLTVPKSYKYVYAVAATV